MIGKGAESPVFDKLGDAGCGGVDPYRSERFDERIGDVWRALEFVVSSHGIGVPWGRNGWRFAWTPR